MMTNPEEEVQFSRLFSQADEVGEQISPSLKARLYSALIHEQQRSGPLCTLDETVSFGRALCVFEKLVQIAPVGENLKSRFYCQVCHARLLGENFDNAPIYWHHCPYVQFKGQ